MREMKSCETSGELDLLSWFTEGLLLSLGVSAYGKLQLKEGNQSEGLALINDGEVEKLPDYKGTESLEKHTSIRLGVFEQEQHVLDIVTELFVTIASISSVLVL